MTRCAWGPADDVGCGDRDICTADIAVIPVVAAILPAPGLAPAHECLIA